MNMETIKQQKLTKTITVLLMKASKIVIVTSALVHAI